MVMNRASKNVYSSVRNLLKELKQPAVPHPQKDIERKLSWQQSPIYPHLREMMHSHTEDDLYNLQNMIIMLQSQHKVKELLQASKGVGERSIEETAHLVGLQLPKLYQDEEHKQ